LLFTDENTGFYDINIVDTPIFWILPKAVANTKENTTIYRRVNQPFSMQTKLN